MTPVLPRGLTSVSCDLQLTFRGVKESTLLMMVMMMTTMMVATVMSVSSLDDNGHRDRREAGDPHCPKLYSNYRPTHTRCLTDNPDAEEVPLGQDLKDFIVSYHNQLRAVNVTNPTASNMQKMIWDDTLAMSARKLAMQCPTDHDEMQDRMEPEWPFVKIGQNIGIGHATFKGMLDRMFTERDRFNYVNDKEYIEKAGHYIQIVTAKTNRVGCGYAKCPNTASKRFRVCNYAFALVANAPPYESGSPCAACPNYCDKSVQMCDCQGKLCYNKGHLDVYTCQCVCKELRTGDNCERVDCNDEDFFSACRSGVTPVSDCGVNTDPMMCPHLCGLCGEQVVCDGKSCYDGFTLDTDTCTCKCDGVKTVVYGKCVPCSEIPCQHGSAILNCRCSCGPAYTGQFCESCLADMDLCANFTADQCTSDLETMCPILCGVCLQIVNQEEVPKDYDANDVVDVLVNITEYDDAEDFSGGGHDGAIDDDWKSETEHQHGGVCRVWMSMTLTLTLTFTLTLTTTGVL